MHRGTGISQFFRIPYSVVEFLHGHRETQDRCLRHRGGRSLAHFRQFDESRARHSAQIRIKRNLQACRHQPHQVNGSAPKSGWRRRFWRNTRSHYLEQDRVLDADVVD
jgi:hypothetical protein